MQIVVYFRTRPVESELSAAALTRQQEAVAAWLDENGATLIGTFTEAEKSTKSRPQLGAALKACREHNASLLIAMTNAIGASPTLNGVFGYLGGVRCHAITHPEANPPALTPTAPDVVVYYRSRPSEPEESERVMVAQHQGVSRWLSVHGGRVIDSFTEAEGTSLDRPALAASFRACKATGATLLVASRDAIGMGSLPTINIVSVPVAVAPTEFTPPATLPMPADTPARLSLYRRFGSSALLSVYLCNPGPGSLTRIVLRSSGVTTKIGPGVSVTAGAERQLDLVEPGCCRLIDTYNLYTDGDRLTPYALTFVDAEGIQRSAGLILGPDDPINAFHAFKLDPEPADPARGGRLR